MPLRTYNQVEQSPGKRISLMGAVLVVAGVLILARLYNLQVIHGQDYRTTAAEGQTTQLDISHKRGQIFAYNDGVKVPLVLNERRWLLFSDTKFIEDVDKVESTLVAQGFTVTDFQKEALESDSRYVVLQKNLSDDQKDSIIEADINGLYFKEHSTRAYTEGDLAAQVLGFVNIEGVSQYGIEQYFDTELTGINGKLKAVTDRQGVPLAFETGNIDQQPINGLDVVLTLDVGLQQIAENTISKGVIGTNAISGSIVILDASDGSVRAMANYPSFDPANYNQTTDSGVFINRAISDMVEPGSVMKPLVAAAALDKGVITVNSTYHDNNTVTLDGFQVSNALNYGAGQRSITEILSKSLNTGSIYLLSQLGGGEVNSEARESLYDYYVNYFGLSKQTGIKLPGESAGTVFSPNDGYGLNIRYGNMTFGQGLTVTPLQLAAAYVPLVNGGHLYKPRVVQSVGEVEYGAELAESKSLSPQTSEDIRELMRRVGEINYKTVQRPGLELSGKTGTGQIADGQGGYLLDNYTGTFAGYIKSGSETLVTVIRIDQPQGVRFAGGGAAAPIWRDLVSEIIKTGKVN